MPAPQFNTSAAASAPTPPVGPVTPTSSQNLWFRGPQVPPNAGINQQQIPSQGSQLMRPPQAVTSSTPRPTQGVGIQGLTGGVTVTGPCPPNPSISSDWVGVRTGDFQVPVSGMSTSATSDGFGLATSGSPATLPPRSQATSGMRPSGPPAKDSKPLDISGNGFASDSIFGGDVFFANPSQPKQDSSTCMISASNLPVSSSVIPISSMIQPSLDPHEALSPGLIYDISIEDYIPFLCSLEYTVDQVQTIVKHSNVTCSRKFSNLGELSYPSFSVLFENNGVVRYTQVLTNVSAAWSIYHVTVNAPPLVAVTVEPPTLFFGKVGDK